MSQSPATRCGYTWPAEGANLDEKSRNGSCCYRKTLSNSDRCVWHADDDAADEKGIETLRATLTPPAVREQTTGPADLLDGASLSGVDIGSTLPLEGMTFRHADFSGAKLAGAVFSNVNANWADFSSANLKNADFTGANLTDTDFSNATLTGADFLDAELSLADVSKAKLGDADFSDARALMADLSEIRAEGHFVHANFSGAELIRTDFSEGYLKQADFSGANLQDANLTNAHLRRANFSNATINGADLTDTTLMYANLEGAKAERTVFVRANLFDANLTDCEPYGATFTDATINDGTLVRAPDRREEDAAWWQQGVMSRIFRPPPRCAYDPKTSTTDEPEATVDVSRVGKAADTYQTFEILARANAQPSLQSSMFVLRQDMQRKRHWLREEYLNWAFAWVSRGVFKHGESLARILAWALLLIVFYAALYTKFDFIVDAGGIPVEDPIDMLYFSTLTFTTLGLGDFQPNPASETGRLLVTSQAALGAILIAVFVFVLGRRAAR